MGYTSAAKSGCTLRASVNPQTSFIIEKVEGSYCFVLVRPSVHPFVRPLQKSTNSFEIS